MDTFNASNGMTVSIHRLRPDLGHAIYDSHGTNTLDNAYSHLNTGEMDALREFFQAENDERLGRWRDPERPHLVVYPADEDDMIRVVDEATGRSAAYYVDDLPLPTGAVRMPDFQGHRDALFAYRAAHPVRPAWADAEVISWHDGDVKLGAVGWYREIAQREPETDHWYYNENGDDACYSLAQMVEFIGDAEVTVLVPKDGESIDELRRIQSIADGQVRGGS